MTDEKELKDQRVPIMMTPSELEAIDDWMFKRRIRSRGEAIRRLCRIGLVTASKSEELFDTALALAEKTGKQLNKPTDAEVVISAFDLSNLVGEITVQVTSFADGAKDIDEATEVAEKYRDKFARARAAARGAWEKSAKTPSKRDDDDLL